MKVIGILIILYLKIISMENRMLPVDYLTIHPLLDEAATPQDDEDFTSLEIPYQKIIGLRKEYNDMHRDEFGFKLENNQGTEKPKKPCSVVVLSNMQNPTMQSLLRKYRYDANGVLIPSSVKYYIKLPQGFGSPSILIPLNDKAFSPLGGFVRYYKEVPPIPPSW